MHFFQKYFPKKIGHNRQLLQIKITYNDVLLPTED